MKPENKEESVDTTFNPIETIVSSIKSIESAVNSKIPEIDHVIHAITSMLEELEKRMIAQETIVSMLLSESPSYQAHLSDSSNIKGEKRAKLEL